MDGEAFKAAMDDPARLALVSSLYGPGTVGAWLLTIISVLISWTLNKRSRREDTVDNDFMAILVLSAVAAGHSIYLMMNLPDGATESLEFSPQVASVEAALTVCETSLIAMLVLFITAAVGKNRKRAYLTLSTGLLSFSAEVLSFTRCPEFATETLNFTRPFLFNAPPLFVAVLVILSSLLLLLLLTMVYFTTMPKTQDSMDVQCEPEASLALRTRQMDADERAMYISAWLSTIALPAAFFLTYLNMIGWFAKTRYMFLTYTSGISLLHYFIPRSNSSIHDLDQDVALTVGVYTLGYSICCAYKSYK